MGIFLAILLTYLLFTLALCFPFCLKLQLLIVNHRLLTSSSSKSRAQRSTGERPFSIHSHNLANSDRLTSNKLSNSNRFISRSISRSIGRLSVDNRPSNVYNLCGPANYSNHRISLTPFQANPNGLPFIPSGASFTLPNNRSSGKLTNQLTNLTANLAADQFARCSQPTNLNSPANQLNEQIYTKLGKQTFIHENSFG